MDAKPGSASKPATTARRIPSATCPALFTSTFNVGSSMFDVRCSFGRARHHDPDRAVLVVPADVLAVFRQLRARPIRAQLNFLNLSLTAQIARKRADVGPMVGIGSQFRILIGKNDPSFQQTADLMGKTISIICKVCSPLT